MVEWHKHPPLMFGLLIPSFSWFFAFAFFLTIDNKQLAYSMFHPPPPFFSCSVLFSQVLHLPPLCVIFSPLCTFSTLVIVKHRLAIVSVPMAPPPPPRPSSFALSFPSADSVPYLCPHPSIRALFCFEGAGGQTVIRISFLCSFTRSFHSSFRTPSI